MKKFVLLLLILPFLVNAQMIFQKEIIFNGSIGITDMVKLPDNGFLATASTINASLDSTSAVLIRFDSLMQVQWCKSFNMLARDDFRCITQASDGNYYVGGTSRYEFSNENGSTLFKFDDSGNVLWHKMYDGSYDDATIGVYEGGSGTIDLIVRKGVSGSPAKILQTDGNGDLLNNYSIETSNTPSGVLPDCATSNGSDDHFIGGTALNNDTGKYMFYIARITDSGVTWYKEYDFGRDVGYLYGITFLSDGEIAATGNIASENNPNFYSAAVMKVNAGTGSVMWAKEIKQSNAYNIAAYEVAEIASGELLVMGRATTGFGLEGYACKLDASGNVLWTREYGDGPYETISYATEITGNRLLFSGKMALNEGPYFVQADANGHTPCLTSLLDCTSNDISETLYTPVVVLSDPELTAVTLPLTIKDIALEENLVCSGIVAAADYSAPADFRVYPNPAAGLFTIAFSEDVKQPTNVMIYNTLGRCVVRKILADNQNRIEADLPPGIYFIFVTDDENDPSGFTKLVIH